jgi:hypothetical protein
MADTVRVDAEGAVMRWLRLYDDVLDDPKVQRLSPELFKHWINLLCLANKGSPRGAIPTDLDDLSFRLRVSVDEATQILVRLSEAGLLERDDENRLHPHGWDQRQFKSDNTTERVNKWRARKDAPEKDETLHATLDVTPPDTDTDTDTDQSHMGRVHAPKAKRATQIPMDWQPPQALIEWAHEVEGFPMFGIGAETKLFRDHFLANGKPMKDWNAAWRNWMRRSREFARLKASANGRDRPEERRPSIPSVDEVFKRQRPAGEVRR